MAEIANNETIHYLSLFRNMVDDKRRVQVPAKWRPSQPEVEFTLFVWKNGPETCLLVLPPAKMAALMQKVDAMSFADHNAQTLRRLLGANSASVTLDKAGRVCIPEDLARAAGLEMDKEALLVGLLDRFEIWNPERYDRVNAVDTASLPEAMKLI